MEQMALQELEEDHRQRVAAAKLDEAELMDNHSLFSHHSSELNVLKDRGSDRSESSLRLPLRIDALTHGVSVSN